MVEYKNEGQCFYREIELEVHKNGVNIFTHDEAESLIYGKDLEDAKKIVDDYLSENNYVVKTVDDRYYFHDNKNNFCVDGPRWVYIDSNINEAKKFKSESQASFFIKRVAPWPKECSVIMV